MKGEMTFEQIQVQVGYLDCMSVSEFLVCTAFLFAHMNQKLVSVRLPLRNFMQLTLSLGDIAWAHRKDDVEKLWFCGVLGPVSVTADREFSYEVEPL